MVTRQASIQLLKIGTILSLVGNKKYHEDPPLNYLTIYGGGKGKSYTKIVVDSQLSNLPYQP